MAEQRIGHVGFRQQVQQVGQQARTQVDSACTTLQQQMTNAIGFVPDEAVFRNATGAEGSMVAKGSGQLSRLSSQLEGFIQTGGENPGIQHKLASAGKTVVDKTQSYFQGVGNFAKTADTHGVGTAIGNAIEASPAFIKVPLKAAQGFGKGAYAIVKVPLSAADSALGNFPSKAREAVVGLFKAPISTHYDAAATAAAAGGDDAARALATAGATKTVRNLATGNVAIQALSFIPRLIGDTVKGFTTGGVGGAIEGATDSTVVQGAGIAGGLGAAKLLSKVAPIVGKIPGWPGKAAQIVLTLAGAAAGSMAAESVAKTVVGTPGNKYA